MRPVVTPVNRVDDERGVTITNSTTEKSLRKQKPNKVINCDNPPFPILGKGQTEVMLESTRIPNKDNNEALKRESIHLVTFTALTSNFTELIIHNVSNLNT